MERGKSCKCLYDKEFPACVRLSNEIEQIKFFSCKGKKAIHHRWTEILLLSCSFRALYNSTKTQCPLADNHGTCCKKEHLTDDTFDYAFVFLFFPSLCRGLN
ncbi:hypothetical protein DAI22_08g229128 [Oryza sativa Japonica Group]|nr:hypothetical protein DAI22_08g229128 [Oryza sativa Japonica Group]